MRLCDLFRFGLAIDHSRVVSAKPNPATLSYVLLVPFAFSPCPEANGGIGFLEIGSPECSSLCLPQVD